MLGIGLPTTSSPNTVAGGADAQKALPPPASNNDQILADILGNGVIETSANALAPFQIQVRSLSLIDLDSEYIRFVALPHRLNPNI